MDEALLIQARKLIRLALEEDRGGAGDITSSAISSTRRACDGHFLVKGEGVIAGLEIAREVFHLVDDRILCEALLADGDAVHDGTTAIEVSGPARTLLTAERTALNFLCRLSGVATLTRAYADRIAGTKARLLDTRKTTPGWRLLEKYAVVCGGGLNHRMGLYDMFLIKDNHIAAAGSISAAVAQCRAYQEEHHLAALIEVESKNIAEVEEALHLHVDRIMLDNMSLAMMSKCVARAGGRIPLEASGNINLDTVRAVAETGVDYISCGRLTHSAPILDISLDFLT